ncbi:hypothetical protein ScPMuIL_009873 [Solemya velum]
MSMDLVSITNNIERIFYVIEMSTEFQLKGMASECVVCESMEQTSGSDQPGEEDELEKMRRELEEVKEQVQSLNKKRKTSTGMEVVPVQEKEKTILDPEKEELRIRLQRSKNRLHELKDPNSLRVKIIGDDSCEHVDNIFFAEVEFVKGLCLHSLTQRVLKKQINLSDYTDIIIHIGGNDIHHLNIAEMMTGYSDLISAITSQTNAGLTLSSIIPRPFDFEKNQRKNFIVNSELQTMCKKRNIQYAKTWKSFIRRQKLIEDYFTHPKSGMWINENGAKRLRAYFIAIVNNLRVQHAAKKKIPVN